MIGTGLGLVATISTALKNGVGAGDLIVKVRVGIKGGANPLVVPPILGAKLVEALLKGIGVPGLESERVEAEFVEARRIFDNFGA